MASKLDSIINKKKLSGAEVGRLVISNTINTYSRAVKGEKQPKPLFSQVQLDRMVNAIEGSRNIQLYNRYISLMQWLEKEIIRTMGYYYLLESSVRAIMLAMHGAYTAEKFLADKHARPLIMTQEEYDHATQKALQDFLEGYNLTLGELLQSALQVEYKNYLKHPRKKSAFKIELDGLAGELIPEDLHKHLKTVYGDDIEISRADTMKKVFLNCLSGDFFPYAFDIWDSKDVGEETIRNDQKMLLKYFRGVLEVALEEVKKYTDKKLSLDDFSVEVIEAETAYKKDIFGFKDEADGASLLDTDMERRGVYIEAKEPLFKNILNNDYFMEMTIKDDSLEALYNSEERQQIIEYNRKNASSSYLYILAFNTVMEVLKKTLTIEDFETVKINEEESKRQIEAINGYKQVLLEFITGQSYLTYTENLEKKLPLFDGCLKGIDLEKIKIDPDKINEVYELFDTDLEFFGKPQEKYDLDIIDILVEGVEYD
ncbi:hypothetical protein HO502_10690 [Streptococcus suis]|nr:hypothetical protein [Streptococcus suis]